MAFIRGSGCPAASRRPASRPGSSALPASMRSLAPAINPYSPDSFPQTVRSEYDFATGTYKMVARPWSEVQADLSKRISGGTFRTDPVPRVYLTPAERALAW